ncbi:NACHT domain-containing protein [Nonomuraea indica]|uniref:NACHT domain-containing protein n=1 Tax=Nonomuraea indica TaxID=1581193 RepID=UPI0011837A1C|nr:hypothetical protein [Nonomuraea indica]
MTERSGGMPFSVGDLSAIAQKSALLLFLDGLDEVADVALRNRVIEEICRTVRRLSESAASLQTIITTRPSALAEVLGFPPRLFESWSLSSLTIPLIRAYSEKWSKAENLKPKEYSELRRILNNKLDQTHMRELARNPMQLTILLSVIRTRGASLPDKRTTLYELYVDLFFAREAGKNDVVKEFREELIDIHRYLAWVLHSEAEKGRALGKIESGRLLEVLRKYLISEDRAPELADKLFHGVTQRVVFLVGAVEGQYKFEVQPLREFFAAKFLYENAPHSTAGNPQPGTIDERFDAIARSTYWQNVTRFYAGCFKKAELPALVERLQILAEEGDHALTHYPRALAATLLADWVFSQNQRSLKSIVQLVLAHDGYRSLFGSVYQTSSRTEPLVLPDGCGRNELLDRCFEVLSENTHSDIRVSIAQLAQANTTVDVLRKRWLASASVPNQESLRNFLLDGYALGVLSRCDLRDITAIASLPQLREAGFAGIAAMAGRWDWIDQDDGLVDDYLDATVFRGVDLRSASTINHKIAYATIVAQTFLLDPNSYFYRNRRTPDDALAHAYGFRFAPKLLETDRPALKEFWTIFETLSKTPANVLQEDISIWRTITEKATLGRGDNWLAIRLAYAATCWVRLTEAAFPNGEDFNLSDASLDLIERLQRSKRWKGTVSWWRAQFAKASSAAERLRVLQIAFMVCGPTTLSRFIASIENFIETLSIDEIYMLSSTERFDFRTRRAGRGYPQDLDLTSLRPRTCALLIMLPLAYRHPDWESARQLLAGYDGNDRVVLEICLLAEVDRHRRGDIDGDGWRRIADFSKRLYAQGRDHEGLVMHMLSRGDTTMPIDLARSIAGNRAAYPLFLVSLAEGSCLRHLAQATVPLADVAREAWGVEVD